MNQHYILPSLTTMVGHADLEFLKNIKFEAWDLVLCIMDYYAKGQDLMYEAYWQSYIMVLNAEMDDAENYMEAKRLSESYATNRAYVDQLYQYLKLSYCTLLQQQGINSNQFNNIAGVSQGYNYFRIEINNGSI